MPCSAADGMPVLFNNRLFSPAATVTECGMPLAQWQAKGMQRKCLVDEVPFPQSFPVHVRVTSCVVVFA